MQVKQVSARVLYLCLGEAASFSKDGHDSIRVSREIVMKNLGEIPRTPRKDRLIRERIHDPYKARLKLPEPALCPQCKAVYQQGRWRWGDPPAGASEVLCQACHRINDRYPAGEMTLGGQFLKDHKTEILHLARNEEKLESGEHPLNRIMEVEDRGQTVVITTTDIHLPRRIGVAVRRAYKGDLDLHYEEESYTIRVRWNREA